MRSQLSTVSAIAVNYGLRRGGAASGHEDLPLGHPMYSNFFPTHPTCFYVEFYE